MTPDSTQERRQRHRRADTPARDGHAPGADGDAASATEVLRLDGVAKSYGDERALIDLSLSVTEGEVFALLGPSGCGKTTLLRTVAGLCDPDAGRLLLRGETIASGESATAVSPEERDVGLVFQDFALFPHLTVVENVAFGLTDRDERDREARVAELLDLVDLAGHGDKYPDELSGGQKQRVALARSLAPEPDVLLLDEPLSNLDVRLRVSMREDLHEILTEAGVTAIWVTHDQEEALSIADRVGVMSEGRLHQIGTPEAVFERPATRFVASFLGQAGFLSARVESDGEALATDIGPVDRDVVEPDAPNEGEIDVLVRPDDLRVTPASEGHAHGRIVRRQYRGPSFVYRVETVGGDVLHCLHNHTESFDVGESIRIELVAGHPLAWYPREGHHVPDAGAAGDALEANAGAGGDADRPRDPP